MSRHDADSFYRPHYPSRLSRRALLRSALLGGSGLLAAHVLGCGDGEGDAAPTATIPPTEPPLTPTPAVTPTPQVLRWERLAPPDPLPPPRRDHSVVTDGQRLYVFAGRDAEDRNDLWVYDLESDAWSEVTSGGGPAPRHGHNAVWDFQRNRMVVFGGQQGGDFFNDTWGFDPEGERWTEVSFDGALPAARYGAGGALAGDDSLFITHGFTNAGRFDDTWEFDLFGDTWQEVRIDGPRPVERCLMRAVWDPALSRLLMFGGQTTATPFLGDLWALTASGWAELTPEQGPSPRTFYAMVFDDTSARVILFGGNTADGPVNDLWFLDATDTWRQPTPENDGPSPRFGQDAAWLPERRSLIVFGGNDGSNDLNDLWELSVPP